MPTLTPQAQALLTDFSKQPGVTADQTANLQSVINNSPALIDQVNSAVAAGHLQHIVALPAGTNAGGEYDGASQSMRLPLGILTTQQDATGANLPFAAGEPTFVFGHELQHGFNRASTAQAYANFDTEAAQIAQNASPVHDYTAAIDRLIGSNRADEASAEIAGWNAVVGSVKTQHPNPTLQDIYDEQPARMADFIDRSSTRPPTYTLKPNLQLEPDLSMQASAGNVEAMGQNYFDKSASTTRLGHLGNSDYTNYYGAYAAGRAGELENFYAKPNQGVMPQMAVNMTQLGLSEKLLEENGINLGSASAQPRAYLDTSAVPPSVHHFDHTATSHTFVPIAAGDPLITDPHMSGAPRATNTVANLSPQSQALLNDAEREVRQVASRHQLPWNQGLDNTVTSVAQHARADGLTSINMFKVHGDEIRYGQFDGLTLKDGSVSARDAANTPVERSLEALAQHDQSLQQQPQQAPAQDLAFQR